MRIVTLTAVLGLAVAGGTGCGTGGGCLTGETGRLERGKAVVVEALPDGSVVDQVFHDCDAGDPASWTLYVRGDDPVGTVRRQPGWSVATDGSAHRDLAGHELSAASRRYTAKDQRTTSRPGVTYALDVAVSRGPSAS